MTHCKWTTPPQEKWLKEHLLAFTDSQANKTMSTNFFPDVFKECVTGELWVCGYGSWYNDSGSGEHVDGILLQGCEDQFWDSVKLIFT